MNDEKSLAGRAYKNGCPKNYGQCVPYLDLEAETSVVAKFKKFIAGLVGKEKVGAKEKQ